MDDDFEKFINNIMKIGDELNLLYKNSDDLVDKLINEIRNLNFSDEDKIIVKFENLLTSITHEISTEIGFFVQDIIRLNKYLQFRIKYYNFSDEILKKIIDDELTIIEKKKIFDENDAKKTIKIIKEIKQEWGKIFENATYKKIKDKMKLDEI